MENNNTAGDSSVQPSLRTAAADSGRARLLRGSHNHVTHVIEQTLRMTCPTPSFSHLEVRLESDTTHPLAQS